MVLLIVFFATSRENNPSLKSTVTQALEGTKGDYAVYVKNLKTGEDYIVNGDRIFESGSLYKLWVMAAVFEKIHKGELKERASKEDIEKTMEGNILEQAELIGLYKRKS